MAERIDDLERFQKLVADALTSEDPMAALLAAREQFPSELADAIDAADRDGVEMTALLVAKLRFERLVQGSREAIEWFERDPADFAAAFKRYHAEVPPTAHDPRGENELFAAWCDASSASRR